MKVQLKKHGVEVSTEMSELVERRVDFALGRFSGRIRRVVVRLEDRNGPRGGVDKSCDFLVDMGLGDPIVARAQSDNLAGAVSTAADRASRAVERRFHFSEMRRPKFFVRE